MAMASTDSNENSTQQRENVVLVKTCNYRGRVRTGCLICRARKVRCDEQRPSCRNCTRIKKTCVYKFKGSHQPPSRITNSVAPALEDPIGQGVESAMTHLSPDRMVLLHGTTSPETSSSPPLAGESIRQIEAAFPAPASEAPMPVDHGEALSHRGSTGSITSIINSPAALSLMTSQDIYLCTTIDLMAATEAPSHHSFTYFVEEVNTPLVSPYDQVNWDRMKTHFTELATHNRAVAAAILAVQALYRAQANGLSTTRAMSLYRAAKTLFITDCEWGTLDLEIVLVVAFLLCLFELIVPDETGSIFGQSEGSFVQRLEAWSVQEYRSPVSLRIEAWVRIIHAAARRGGGPGILSDIVGNLLGNHTASDLPGLSYLDPYTDAATSVYDIVSAPIFAFYLGLQKLSAQIADLSHYHRSRFTSTDQEEVAALMANLKTGISRMWEARPGLMQFEPGEIRAQFSRTIAEQLIALVGMCNAAYHTEVVEIGRTLSDPPLASAEAKQAMRHIRDIVEGDWNASSGGKLSPGYLRPLFLCAIESIQKEDTQWAVERLKQINDPISRSRFFASFAKSLAEAQRGKERRVTTKWFCYQTFGVSPPFL